MNLLSIRFQVVNKKLKFFLKSCRPKKFKFFYNRKNEIVDGNKNQLNNRE